MTTSAIYEGTPGTRLRTDRLHLLGTTAEALVEAAVAEATAGAGRIELCGGVGVDQAAAVREALPGSVELGLVRYGFESLELIAEFKQEFLAGSTPEGRQVFVHLDPDRGGARTDHEEVVVVAVDGAAQVPAVLRALHEEQPLGLVELYDGLGIRAAAVAWEALEASTPVGFVDVLHG